MAPFYANNMTLCRNWRAVASNPFNFGSSFAFPHAAVNSIVACANAFAGDSILWCEVMDERRVHVLRRKGVRFVEEVRYDFAESEWTPTVCVGLTDCGVKMVVCLFECILSLHSWNVNSASSAFGLSPIDIMIVDALLDPSKAANLSATQVSVLKKVSSFIGFQNCCFFIVF